MMTRRTTVTANDDDNDVDYDDGDDDDDVHYGRYKTFVYLIDMSWCAHTTEINRNKQLLHIYSNFPFSPSSFVRSLTTRSFSSGAYRFVFLLYIHLFDFLAPPFESNRIENILFSVLNAVQLHNIQYNVLHGNVQCAHVQHTYCVLVYKSFI